MPFSQNRLKTTTGIYRFTALKVNKYTLSYRFLNGNVHGCVFAKNRPVSLNWTDYNIDTDAENVTTCSTELAKKHVPNKTIICRPSDPYWLTTYTNKKKKTTLQ